MIVADAALLIYLSEIGRLEFLKSLQMIDEAEDQRRRK